MKLWTLYTITNTVNGKVYVGITTRFFARMKEHFSGRGSKLIARAIRKYGRSALKFSILTVGGEHAIKLLEIDQIARCSSRVPLGYNLTDGCDGACGAIPGPETRRKMSETRTRLNLGHKHSEMTKARIGQRHRGKKISDTQKAKLSSRKGSLSPRAHPVMAAGVMYATLGEAAAALHIPYPTLVDRFRRWRDAGVFPDGYEDTMKIARVS